MTATHSIEPPDSAHPQKLSWKGTIQAMKKWKRYSSGSKNDGSRSFHCQCHASHCRIYICKLELRVSFLVVYLLQAECFVTLPASESLQALCSESR